MMASKFYKIGANITGSTGLCPNPDVFLYLFGHGKRQTEQSSHNPRPTNSVIPKVSVFFWCHFWDFNFSHTLCYVTHGNVLACVYQNLDWFIIKTSTGSLSKPRLIIKRSTALHQAYVRTLISRGFDNEPVEVLIIMLSS